MLFNEELTAREFVSYFPGEHVIYDPEDKDSIVRAFVPYIGQKLEIIEVSGGKLKVKFPGINLYNCPADMVWLSKRRFIKAEPTTFDDSDLQGFLNELMN